MKRYVIIVENSRVLGVEGKINDALNQHGVQWWHYLENTWLVKDRGFGDVSSWQNMIESVAPKTRNIVLEVDAPYQGRLPQAAHDWFTTVQWSSPF